MLLFEIYCENHYAVVKPSKLFKVIDVFSIFKILIHLNDKLKYRYLPYPSPHIKFRSLY